MEDEVMRDDWNYMLKVDQVDIKVDIEVDQLSSQLIGASGASGPVQMEDEAMRDENIC